MDFLILFSNKFRFFYLLTRNFAIALRVKLLCLGMKNK